MMHLLKVVIILSGILFYFISAAPGINYVRIGGSNDQQKLGLQNRPSAENKSYRGYSSSYPILVHQHKPSSEHYNTGYGGSYGGGGGSQPSLISANVHLLEPFMLVTFLLFVLSLIDKARIPSILAARDDFIQEIPLNFTRFEASDAGPYHFEHLKMQNDTE